MKIKLQYILPLLCIICLSHCVEMALKGAATGVYYTTDSTVPVAAYTPSQSPDRLAATVFLRKIQDRTQIAHQGRKSANSSGLLYTEEPPSELVTNALMSELVSRGVSFSLYPQEPTIEVRIRTFFLAPDGQFTIGADVSIQLSATRTETRNVRVVLKRPAHDSSTPENASRAFEWGLAAFTRNLADTISPILREASRTGTEPP